MVTADPIPVDQESLAEQAIAECPRAALSRRGLEALANWVPATPATRAARPTSPAASRWSPGRPRAWGDRRPSAWPASGATVVVNDMAAALDGSDVFDEIVAAGTAAVAVAGDISQRTTADELVASAEGLGGLHIVVNNAGITRDRMLFNMTDEDWDAVIAVHLRGHFLLTRHAATYWRAKAKDSDGTVYGRIINTSSEAGLSVRSARPTTVPPKPGSPRSP